MEPRDAALAGSRQIGFTIVSLTLSLIAVLIPLLFMGDVVGRLFREFAVTLAVAILISAAVSLTLAPMLCATVLRPRRESEESALARFAKRQSDKVTAFYGRLLDHVFARQGLTLAVAALTLLLTVYLYVVIPKGFFPVQDTGVLQGISVAPDWVSFEAMAERQQALAKVLLADPDVESLSSFIGVDGVNMTPNTGHFLITLKPHGERTASAEAIGRRLTRASESVPGITLTVQPVQDLAIETSVSRTQYRFVLAATDPAAFADFVPELVERLRQQPQLEDVASDLEAQGLAAVLTVDRDTAARFGITLATIDNALYDAFGQRIVSTIFTQSNQRRVILETDPAFTPSVDSLLRLYLPSSTATSGEVPLSAIAQVAVKPAPLLISHFGPFPAASISFNLAPGVSLGEAVETVRKVEQEIGLPPGMTTHFQGAALAFEASLTNELWLILAALVCVYIVLGILYESFIHPVTILSTLPSAGVGALLALMAARMDLGVIGVIGIVLLIGIVKKNAIMMIDFALQAERQRRPFAARGDQAGLPSAAAADPDDDLRRDVRRAALDARHGCWRGAPPAARRRHRRRLGALPDPDAVHDAGDLSRLRPAGETARPYRIRGPGAATAGGRANEHLGPLHKAAGGDHAAHPRHRARWRARLFQASASRRCRRWICRRSMCRPPCRGRARRLWRASRRDAARATFERDRRCERDDVNQLDADRHEHLSAHSAWAADLDGAARDVQAAINAARADLPAALSVNPTYSSPTSRFGRLPIYP